MSLLGSLAKVSHSVFPAPVSAGEAQIWLPVFPSSISKGIIIIIIMETSSVRESLSLLGEKLSERHVGVLLVATFPQEILMWKFA